MKKILITISAFCCLACPAFARENTSAPEQSPLILRLNVKPDTRYSTQADIETQSATIVNGKHKTEARQTLTFLMDTRILAVGENGVSMRIFFKGLRMKVKAGDLSLAYDSAKPPVPKKNPTTRQELAQASMVQVMGGFIGQSVDYSTSPDGKVIKITGLQATLNRMIARAKLPSKSQTAEFKESMTHLLKQAVGDGDRPNQMTGFYTAKPLQPGDAWSQTQLSGGMLLPTRSDITYILKSRDNGIATLAMMGYFFDNEKPAGPSNSIFANSTVSGRQHGTLRIDESSGWLLSFGSEFRSLTEMDYKGEESMHIKVFNKGSIRMKSTPQ